MSFLHKVTYYRKRGNVLTRIQKRKPRTSWMALAIISSCAVVSTMLWSNLEPFPVFVSYAIQPSVREQSEANEPLLVEEKIREIAEINDYSYNANFLVNLAQCESGLNPEAIGGSYHGLYQIHVDLHEDMSLECSHEIECSTIWTIDRLKNNEYQLWPNCPTGG